MKKVLSIALAALVLAASLIGCSAGSGSDADISGDMVSPGAPSHGDAADKPSYSPDEEAGGAGVDKGDAPLAGVNVGASERKRIQYVTVELETLKFEDTVNTLRTRTAAVGGYIESSRETGRSLYGTGTRRAELVLRIPTDELDGFESGIDDLGSVLSRYTTTDDVTDKYFDTEARLKSLEAQRDKYMELLRETKDMEYVIRLTDALTDVIYQIELYTGTLNKYDSLIDYSTVTVNVNEVAELTKAESPTASFGEKIKNAFLDSVGAFVDMCEMAVIGITAAIPFLILPAVAAVIIVIVVRRRAKKRRRAYAAMMAAQNGNGEGT